MSRRNEVEEFPTYEKIDELCDAANDAEVYYMIAKKPPLPVMSTRDSVFKGYHRESYIQEPNTHVFARHTIATDIEKYKEKKPGMFSGYQRLNQIMAANFLTENAEHNGSEIVFVFHNDMGGSVPGAIRGIVKGKIPPEVYGRL